MVTIYPAIAWLATLLSPSGALSHRMLASFAKLELYYSMLMFQNGTLEREHFWFLLYNYK